MNAAENITAARKPAAEMPEGSAPRRWQKGGLDFSAEGTTLYFRQARSVAAYHLFLSALPLVAGVGMSGVMAVIFWPMVDFHAPLTVILCLPPIFPILLAIVYFAWMARARTVPFCVDAAQNAIWRGKRRLCALDSVKGVRVVRVQGRGTWHHLELLLDANPNAIRLPESGDEDNARLAAGELARRLNVPCLPERKEGLF